ncbi:hypothetical protein PsorP6_017435 [Peronosclerospora sorghi]|uniref:Uncharacterized protein n=1 Tax=Peronosclerospora sorghi TaxID=230839 RepID=A0ACC0WPF6_9STRA|nr:hypothetical protein PsorP6_017435 [Peronosclerospora sorghi]
MRNENETLASKVEDIMSQLTHARQQREDTKARYFDVSSKFNQVLEEKEEWMKAADSVESRNAAECVRNMETQLAEWKTEMAATTNEWALEKHELTQEIESLSMAHEKATTAVMQVDQLQEQNQSIESLLEIKTHEIQVITAQLAAAKTLEDNTIDNTTENAVEIETPTSPSLADTKQLRIALETTTQQDLSNQKFGAVITTSRHSLQVCNE